MMNDAPTRRQTDYMHRLIKELGIDEDQFYIEQGFVEPTLFGNQTKEYKITKRSVSYAINRLLEMKRKGVKP